MERTHQLIKLKVGTVQNLKHLKKEMGLNSLDALINTMIRVTNEHRLFYKNTGWIGSPKEKLKNQ
jgi:hypothetical protein